MDTLTHFYSVAAYRPDGVDSCRGCVMARSDSAFDLRSFTNVEDAARFWASKEFESKHSDREYASWELTVLVDGGSLDDWWRLSDDAGADREPLFDAFHDRCAALFKELTAEHAEMQRLKQQAQLQQQQQAARQAEAAREAAERAELARLQAKYANP